MNPSESFTRITSKNRNQPHDPVVADDGFAASVAVRSREIDIAIWAFGNFADPTYLAFEQILLPEHLAPAKRYTNNPDAAKTTDQQITFQIGECGAVVK